MALQEQSYLHVMEALISAYAEETSKILNVLVSNELSNEFQTEKRNLSWAKQVKFFGLRALIKVKEKTVINAFILKVNEIIPPVHISEYSEFLCPYFRWTEVINRSFIDRVLYKMYCYHSYDAKCTLVM